MQDPRAVTGISVLGFASLDSTRDGIVDARDALVELRRVTVGGVAKDSLVVSFPDDGASAVEEVVLHGVRALGPADLAPGVHLDGVTALPGDPVLAPF